MFADLLTEGYEPHDVKRLYIHGTPDEASMGYNASHGCVRMKMADAEDLFERVGVDTRVVIVNVAPPRFRPGRIRASARTR